MGRGYDAIVVGARCAGAPAAMLLARMGHRVLVVDRARFPSDTLSTHVLHPRAVGALRRWGLLDRLAGTGCPPIERYTVDFGSVRLEGRPGKDDSPLAYCPRRTVLDALLVGAAAEAGAEVREDFVVDEVLREFGRVVGVRGHTSRGEPIREHARFVVGADGRSSVVEEAVHPERYDERPPLMAPYYGYWSGLPMDGRFEIYVRPHRGFGAAPTHDGLTLVFAGWPTAEFASNKKDVEANFVASLALAPEFAERVRAAKCVSRLAGAPTPNYFTKPYGPGWALVGDAGYLKDPITAQGILDAFRDAERCAIALDEVLTGARAFEEAMRDYQRERDEDARAMYEFTCQMATLEPPPPELQALLAALPGNQAAIDAFVQMNAGTLSPARFFAPENVAAIRAAAARH